MWYVLMSYGLFSLNVMRSNVKRSTYLYVICSDSQPICMWYAVIAVMMCCNVVSSSYLHLICNDVIGLSYMCVIYIVLSSGHLICTWYVVIVLMMCYNVISSYLYIICNDVIRQSYMYVIYCVVIRLSSLYVKCIGIIRPSC